MGRVKTRSCTLSLRRIVFAEYKDSTRYKQGAHIGARVGHCIHARAGSGCGPLMVVGGSCPIYLISKRHDNGLPKICSDSAPTTHTCLTVFWVQGVCGWTLFTTFFSGDNSLSFLELWVMVHSHVKEWCGILRKVVEPAWLWDLLYFLRYEIEIRLRAV